MEGYLNEFRDHTIRHISLCDHHRRYLLVSYADEIAERTGLGRLLIGSILLAGTTSLPELSVDIAAVRSGIADLAVGDLMGSCLFNLLILAILDLSWHSRKDVCHDKRPAMSLSGNVSSAELPR